MTKKLSVVSYQLSGKPVARAVQPNPHTFRRSQHGILVGRTPGPRGTPSSRSFPHHPTPAKSRPGGRLRTRVVAVAGSLLAVTDN